jgi:hypothetical protein
MVVMIIRQLKAVSKLLRQIDINLRVEAGGF